MSSSPASALRAAALATAWFWILVGLSLPASGAKPAAAASPGPPPEAPPGAPLSSDPRFVIGEQLARDDFTGGPG